MTIIVGLLCSEGVVIASDSQAGYSRGVDRKRLDFTKIYDYAFDQANVVVTGAGMGPFITRAVEMLEEKSSSERFNKGRQIADMAEAVMVELHKKYVVDRQKELGFMKARSGSHVPSKQDEWGGLGLALMLGACCNKEFGIYTVYPGGIADRAER